MVPSPPSVPESASQRIEEVVRQVFTPHLAGTGDARFWRRLAGRWRRTLHGLRPLGGSSAGNTLEVFCDGDEAFEAMWRAIAGARRSVVLAAYTIEPDRVGRRTLDLLEAAAQRGVDVRLHFDAVGSRRLADEWTAGLERAGVGVNPFNPILSRRTRLASVLVRDHRKILVVDGEVAFCGGMNVSEDYAGPRHGRDLFRDTHLRLTGPCVADLADLLSEGPVPPGARTERWKRFEPVFVQILESNRRRKRRTIQRALRYTLARATRSCRLTSPYFLPPRPLRRAITRAASRGVDVRILTVGRSDAPLFHLASQHVYGHFLRHGVRLFEMRDRVLHAKTVTIDGVYGSVGSFNLDRLSYLRNLEVSVTALDPVLARRLDEQFEADLEISEEVTLSGWEGRSLPRRVLCWLAYRLARLV